MENLEVTIENEKLVFVVDLRREVGWTNGGRSVRIASSGGNITLMENGRVRPERFNLNVWRPATSEEKRSGVFLKAPPQDNADDDEDDD